MDAPFHHYHLPVRWLHPMSKSTNTLPGHVLQPTLTRTRPPTKLFSARLSQTWVLWTLPSIRLAASKTSSYVTFKLVIVEIQFRNWMGCAYKFDFERCIGTIGELEWRWEGYGQRVGPIVQ